MSTTPGRLAVLALLAAACGEAEPPSPRPTGPHLIVVSIDTLRADHLGCYGYGRPTSPRIDALAEDSLLFEDVMATSCSTAPSHMTMFTGTLPRVHGIFNGRPALLAPDVPYLPALLAERGYRTAAFADGGILTEPFGFAEGFEHFASTYEPFETKLDTLETWLVDAPDEPTFLFVHTYAAHQPYMPPDGHDLFTDPAYTGRLRGLVRSLGNRRERGQMADLGALQEAFMSQAHDFAPADVEYLIGLYDGCIHGVDAGIARLLALLEAKGWLDEAWLVVTSDHGEAFGEHGYYSHRKLYQQELWVPLLIRPPGGTAPRRIGARISQLDLTPTLLGLLGLPAHPAMQGKSLLPFEELVADRRVHATEGSLKQDAVIDGPWKLIERVKRATELYALDTDADEQTDLAEARAGSAELARLQELIAEMRAESAQLQSRLGEPQIGMLPQDTERADELRALGYIK